LQRLKSSLLLLPLLLIGFSVSGGTRQSSASENRLRLYHMHTGERLDIVFRRDGAYIPEALAQVDHFLRDHRTGDVHPYDPRLFDLLADLEASIGRPGAEIDIICGYRTPWSNGYLRTHTAGVARNSLHMQAEAIDIRVPGTKTSALRDAALALHRGGGRILRSI